MRFFIYLIVCVSLLISSEQSDNNDNEDVATIEELPVFLKNDAFSFSRSKLILAKKIYPLHQKAFYSGCKYVIKEKKLVPILKSCGFKYRKNENRANRIEWEHIVPAWHFGHQLKCWQNGGRRVCREKNTKFKRMEADMHNLVPSIGEINGDRSNFKYGMIEGEKRVYGKVNMEIDFANKRAEPRESVWGDIARTYFYMRDKYGLQISRPQEKLFIAWNNLDPVDSWEKKKNELVKKLQGDDNPYVSNYRKIKEPKDLGTETTSQAESFDEIKKELKEKYSFIWDKLIAPVSSTLLFLLTLYVYMKRKNKNKKESKKSSPIPEPSSTATTSSSSSKDSYKSPKEDYFMIITKLGDSAISFNEDDEVIIEKTDKSNPKQHWTFPKANKKKKFFFIENPHVKKVIEVKDADTNDGAKIVLGKKKKRNNDYQEWSLEEAKDEGYYFIVNRWTLGVLDVRYKKTADGTRLQNFHKKVRGTENQEWKIVKI